MVRYQDTSIAMAKIKVLTIPSADKHADKMYHTYILGRNEKWYVYSVK